MDQPVFWGVLAATAAVGIGLRLVARRPLWPRRSSVIPPWELAVAGVMVAALVFHCAAMFFASWVNALPFADEPARSVRNLGLTSQVAYWAPAAILVVALRRVWPPVLGLLTATLVGVGYTMFVPHALNTSLAWIAGAAIILVMIAAALVVPLRRESPAAA